MTAFPRGNYDKEQRVIAPEQIEPGMVVEYRQTEHMKPERGRVVEWMRSNRGVVVLVDLGDEDPKPINAVNLYPVSAW
jgi:hypothetical protein